MPSGGQAWIVRRLFSHILQAAIEQDHCWFHDVMRASILGHKTSASNLSAFSERIAKRHVK